MLHEKFGGIAAVIPPEQRRGPREACASVEMMVAAVDFEDKLVLKKENGQDATYRCRLGRLSSGPKNDRLLRDIAPRHA